MELKQFIKQIITGLVEGVEEVREKSSRDMYLISNKETNQAIEFDIAVTTENNDTLKGGGGIKVLQLLQIGSEIGNEVKNSSISRVKFGVHIDSETKEEVNKKMREFSKINSYNENI